jgi:hypothetical protein
MHHAIEMNRLPSNSSPASHSSVFDLGRAPLAWWRTTPHVAICPPLPKIKKNQWGNNCTGVELHIIRLC